MLCSDNWEFGFYDAQNLVKARDFIVVSPNYRLGPLGFLALDQLKKENAGGSTGQCTSLLPAPLSLWLVP